MHGVVCLGVVCLYFLSVLASQEIVQHTHVILRPRHTHVILRPRHTHVILRPRSTVRGPTVRVCISPTFCIESAFLPASLPSPCLPRPFSHTHTHTRFLLALLSAEIARSPLRPRNPALLCLGHAHKRARTHTLAPAPTPAPTLTHTHTSHRNLCPPGKHSLHNKFDLRRSRQLSRPASLSSLTHA